MSARPLRKSEAQEVALHLDLHPKQLTALNTLATEVLYGGAAGGGKSHLMRVAAVLWCAMIPGLQVYLFRRLSDDLTKNHVEGPKGFRMLLAPWISAGFVHLVEGEIRFWNGSKIWLCHCKDEKDRFKYLGAEIHVLMIDELTTFSETIYRFLRSRVRQVGLAVPEELKGRFPRILCGSNPGGVGHHFVKAMFIDGAEPMVLRQMEGKEGGMLRQFIPARLDENPSMTTDDPGYRAKLQGLGSEALVKAMEDGDWNVVAGAFFNEWSTGKHVLTPFRIPPHWLRFTGFDWGSSHPFAVLWCAVSDGGVPGIPAGAIVVYREWYGASGPNVGLKLETPKIAQGIVSREISEKITYRVGDPSCWDSSRGPSIAETMLKHGVIMGRGDNKRVPGAQQVRDRLIGIDGRPMLYVFSICTDLIRTLPALQHNDRDPEDIDTNGDDHLYDALRYACMSRPWVKPAPPQNPFAGVDTMTMEEAWKLARKPAVRDPRI